MKIEHLAIWVKDLESMKDFYSKYFNAKAGELYHNPKKNFTSYFLSFDSGCRLELMHSPKIGGKDSSDSVLHGLAHFAISVGSKSEVDVLTNALRQEGYKVVGEPRTTGDGYYESVVFDLEKNRIEITI